MFTPTRLLTVLAAATLGIATAAPLRGSETSLHTNVLTFGGPVALPGVTLAAGTYIFERVEPTNPDIVAVRSGDRRRAYFVGMTLRNERPAGLDPTRLVTFAEPARGAALRITAWYPAGERLGHAFLYR